MAITQEPISVEQTLVEQTKTPPTTGQRGFGFGLVDLLLLIVVSFWGINFSAAKIALDEMQPLTFNALRMSLALGIFLVIHALREGRSGFQLPAADWRRVLSLGFFGNFVFITCFAFGLATVPVGAASLIQAVTPLMVAILAFLFFRQRLGSLTWLGIFVSLVGIAIVIFGGQGIGEASSNLVLLGEFVLLIGTVSWASYTLFSAPLLKQHSPLKVTTLAALTGVPLIVAVSIPSLLSQDWAAITWRGWLATLYSGICSIVIAYVLWYYAISKVGGPRTAVYANLVPVVAILFAFTFRGEPLTLWELLGGAIVFAGIALTRRDKPDAAAED